MDNDLRNEVARLAAMVERQGEQIKALKTENDRLQKKTGALGNKILGNLVNPLFRTWPFVPLRESDPAVAFLYFCQGGMIGPGFIGFDLGPRVMLIFLAEKASCFCRFLAQAIVYLADALGIFCALFLCHGLFKDLIPKTGAVEFLILWLCGYLSNPVLMPPAAVIITLVGASIDKMLDKRVAPHVPNMVFIGSLALVVPLISEREERHKHARIYPFAVGILMGLALLQHKLLIPFDDVVKQSLASSPASAPKQEEQWT